MLKDYEPFGEGFSEEGKKFDPNRIIYDTIVQPENIELGQTTKSTMINFLGKPNFKLDYPVRLFWNQRTTTKRRYIICFHIDLLYATVTHESFESINEQNERNHTDPHAVGFVGVIVGSNFNHEEINEATDTIKNGINFHGVLDKTAKSETVKRMLDNKEELEKAEIQALGGVVDTDVYHELKVKQKRAEKKDEELEKERIQTLAGITPSTLSGVIVPDACVIPK